MPTSRADWRRRALLGLTLAVIVGALWGVGAAAPPPSPYSPSSTSGDGAKALYLLLRELGARVETTGPLPAPGHAIVLVLRDELDDAARAQVVAWARQGGTLVVADPASRLAQAPVAFGGPNQPALAPSSLPPGCPAPWVAGVASVDPGPAYLLEEAPGGSACFGDGANAFAFSRPIGRGVVVSLGGAAIWSNAYLAHADNALLAANLLVPVRGYEARWLTAPWVLGGTKTLWQLVPGRADAALAALGLGLLVACAWKARRLGRPVAETIIAPVPASELVAATGRLLARNRLYREAAQLERSELLSDLRHRFGQAPSTSAATVATVVAQQTGLPKARVLAALDGPPPAKEQDLLEIAGLLQEVRHEALG
jgi:hypothetical protein